MAPTCVSFRSSVARRSCLDLLGRPRVERQVLVVSALVLKVILVLVVLADAGEPLDGLRQQVVPNVLADRKEILLLGEEVEEGSRVEANGRLVRLVNLARRLLDEVVLVILPVDRRGLRI